MILHPQVDDPRLYSRGMRGLSGGGGLSGGPAGASSCAEYIANAFSAMPAASEAAMLLNTPSPSGDVLAELYINTLPSTPAATAQAVVSQLAQEYCGAVADELSSGDPNAATPPDCGDGGAAAAAAAYPRWLAYYNSLPAAIWTSGTASGQVVSVPVSTVPGGPVYNVAPSPLPSPTPTPQPAPVAQPSSSAAVNTQGNALTPPAGNQALPAGSVVTNQSGSGMPVGTNNTNNTDTAGAGGGTDTTSSSSSSSSSSFDIAAWLQQNWIIAAAAGVGLILLMKE